MSYERTIEHFLARHAIKRIPPNVSTMTATAIKRAVRADDTRHPMHAV
jgi:hypothetical protein